MTFRLVDMNVPVEIGQGRPAAAWRRDPDQRRGFQQMSAARVCRCKARDGPAARTLSTAKMTPSTAGRLPIRDLQFDSIGGILFGKATTRRQQAVRHRASTTRCSARRSSAPRSRGSGEISWNFKTPSRTNLALLRAPAPPPPAAAGSAWSARECARRPPIRRPIRSPLVKLGLGRRPGSVVIAHGPCLYCLFGLFANVARIFNGILLIGCLSIFSQRDPDAGRALPASADPGHGGRRQRLSN